MGVIPNRAVSAAYEYLIGLDAPDFVERFLPGGNGTTWPLLRKVGGWTMMYTADMRRVAPHWLAYTEAVRTAPDGRKYWFRLGDAYVTEDHPRPWISEMYGYSFGSAAAGVDHMVDHNLMLYPTYAPNPDFPPSILHYGLEFKVGPVYAFDKHWHVTGDRLGACPMQLFDAPPDVEEVLKAQFGVDEQGKLRAPASEVGRYTLAALTVNSLNAALAREKECVSEMHSQPVKTACARTTPGTCRPRCCSPGGTRGSASRWWPHRTRPGRHSGCSP